MELPAEGVPLDAITAELDASRAGDVDWAGGKTFGLVFDGGPSVHDVAEAAAVRFLHDNFLNPAAFPSLARFQADIVGWTAGLLHAPPGAAGFVTSGGTESIQCAVLAARDRARHERGVERPEMVVAESAHAAFHKAAHLFGLDVRTTPVGDDWRADVGAMADAVSERTVLVVASAPQYPQGVVDDVAAIAAVAAEAGAHCHVDACMGGFVLPFAERLGRPVPPWDFRVDGVHSISADVHKLGYAPKGASVVLYRTKELRRYQTFRFDGWLGGEYGSPHLQGTRSGLPIAAAWAVMRHLGVAGYVERTAVTLAVADRMRAAVAATAGLRVLGDGDLHLVAIAADPAAAHPLDPFALGDGLAARGWYHDRQGPPDSLHSTVSFANAASADAWHADFAAVAAGLGGSAAADRSTRYSTVE